MANTFGFRWRVWPNETDSYCCRDQRQHCPSVLRQKWIEFAYFHGPDGKPLSWDTLVVNKGKKRVKLQIPVGPDHETVQEDLADCEWLHWHINRWFEDLGSSWSYTFEEVRK